MIICFALPCQTNKLNGLPFFFCSGNQRFTYEFAELAVGACPNYFLVFMGSPDWDAFEIDLGGQERPPPSALYRDTKFERRWTCTWIKSCCALYSERSASSTAR
uniref:Uncharacterized protein n=1 Tax=Escherichia coli TaxID=562 RepID=A0A899NEF1_ECOLX|nr:hypothetical protein LDMDHDEC_00231 [Escherichia coli]QSM61912.1 hypothetical protein LDMDHDEC_00737 [Escherichia coli]